MIDQFELSVKIAIVMSGFYLWIGMLTGVWKYAHMKKNQQARAHYYVDIAHRSSLLYAPATLILAVLAYCSIWSENWNLLFVAINLIFFSFSILSYVIHGYLQDTSNQFRQPHQFGRWQLPSWILGTAMILLVIGEVFATAALFVGATMGLFA